MDGPWGHLVTCPCSLCSCLRRLCQCVARFSAHPGFLEYATRELRVVWGSLEDYADRIPPGPKGGETGLPTGGTAPPPTAFPAPAAPAVPPNPGQDLGVGTGLGKSRAEEPLPGLTAAPKASSTSGARSSEPPRAPRKRRSEDRDRRRRASTSREKKHRKKDKSGIKKEKKRSRSERPDTVEVKVEQPTSDDEQSPGVSRPAVPARDPDPRGPEEVAESPTAPSGREPEESEAARRETPSPEAERGERPTLTPRPPSQPPPGRRWEGPIPAGRRHNLPRSRTPRRGVNKGAKKRQTQRDYKEYRDYYGSGEGFYESRRHR